MTRTEDLLADVLRERADHEVSSTPLPLVVSTARRIRRGRQVRAGALTAVVVAALAVPFVVGAARSPDASTDPAATPAPPTPSGSASVPAGSGWIADLAQGGPPGIAWVEGSDYIAADGTRTTLPYDDVTRATPYLDGFLVARFGDPHLIRLDDRMTEVRRWCTTGALGVSADGARTAYTSVACEGDEPVLHVEPTDGTGEPWVTPVPLADGSPVGLLDDAVVIGSLNTGPPVVLRADGTSTTLDPLKVAAAVDEPLGLVSGQLAGGRQQDQTGVVVDADTGEVIWSAEGWQLGAFSPDGSQVLGVRLDGTGTTWGVLDSRTGEVGPGLALPPGLEVWQSAWEDDEHLLLSVTEDGAETVLRVTVDGGLERAADVVPAGDGDRRFSFAPNEFR